LIVIGIIVIYLSFSSSEEIGNDFNYKNTDFYKELENLKIKNEKINKLKNKVGEYIIGSSNLVNSIIVSILSN
jgi:hypothetical protein